MEQYFHSMLIWRLEDQSECESGSESESGCERSRTPTLFVDPPGLEPGLCGTKIRRVANYTMGQSTLFGAAKLEKKFNSYNPLTFFNIPGLSHLKIILLQQQTYE
jgi:hypothetical protein